MDFVNLICCALAFVLYINTLNSGFVYDDRRAILSNSDVSGSNWLNVFRNDFWGTPLKDSGSHGSYRPLCVLSFRMNFLLGGFTPWGFHLINNLMHCIATGLVVKLARHFISSVWGVVATGALFAAHPIHTEAVAGIVGRADLCACIFYLLTYLTYMRHIHWRENGDHRQWAILAITVCLSLIALLFKETAITALLVCGLFDVIRGLCGVKDKHRVRSVCLLTLALICTLYFRLLVLPRTQTPFSTADNPIAKNNSLWTRFLTFLYLPVFNFKLLVNPYTLSFDWGMDAIPRVTTIWDRRNLLTIVFYGTLITTTYKCWQLLTNGIKQQKMTTKHTKNDAQYQLQQMNTSRHNQRRSRTKIKHAHAHAQKMANYAGVAPAHMPYVASTAVNEFSLMKQNILSSPQFICAYRNCKQDINSTRQHTASCRAMNNNNNVVIPSSTTATNIFNECCCHQLLSSNHHQRTPHLLSLAIHKAIATITPTPRNSRSSSSCSNTTTDSNKSYSSNSSSCSSLDSNNSTTISTTTTQTTAGTTTITTSAAVVTTMQRRKLHMSHNNMQLPKDAQNKINACILLMAIAFLTLPFLPATNLFFYVGFVVAERLLYLPSVGYCLLVGYGIAKLMEPLTIQQTITKAARKRKIALILCMSLAISVLSVRTIRRNMDWRDEESLFRSAVQINPPKALGNLGSVLSSQARYNEAKDVLLDAIKYRPNMADVHFNLGILYQNQQNYKSAVESFQRAINFRPNLAAAYLNLGASLIGLGKCQEAAHVLQEATKIDGTGVRDRDAHEKARTSSYLQLGALYVEQGKLQRALAVYREALHTLSSTYYQRDVIYLRIGDILGRLRQWDEAERHHRAALELQPNHVEAHVSYGITLARNSSRASEAELWFKRAMQLAPEQASVYHHYAEFLTKQSRHDEAIIYHIRAAELLPNDYSLVVAAATALRLHDRKLEAESWYRKAVALRPEDAHAHTNLGAILHLLGRTNNAVKSYKEALKLQPGDRTTLENLAKLGVKDFKS